MSKCEIGSILQHDDVIKWKHGQWRRALMFSLICAWINRWVNNREAGDLRRHHAHYDVIVMYPWHTVIVYRRKMQWKWKCEMFFLCWIYYELSMIKPTAASRRKELRVHWSAVTSIIRSYFHPYTSSMWGVKGSYGSHYTRLWVPKRERFSLQIFSSLRRHGEIYSPSVASVVHSWWRHCTETLSIWMVRCE